MPVMSSAVEARPAGISSPVFETTGQMLVRYKTSAKPSLRSFVVEVLDKLVKELLMGLGIFE